MKQKNNKIIRESIRQAGLCNWQVADALGIHETAFCVKLRRELPDTEKQKILSVVDSLAEESLAK